MNLIFESTISRKSQPTPANNGVSSDVLDFPDILYNLYISLMIYRARFQVRIIPGMLAKLQISQNWHYGKEKTA